MRRLRYLAVAAAFLAPPLLLVSDVLLIRFISTPGLAFGALLFPLGHQSGAPAVLIAGDVAFLAAFWSLARRMMHPAATAARRHGA